MREFNYEKKDKQKENKLIGKLKMRKEIKIKIFLILNKMIFLIEI